MKVKVMKEFEDKRTHELRKAGSTFEATKTRVKEILTAGPFVEEVKEVEEVEENEDK